MCDYYKDTESFHKFLKNSNIHVNYFNDLNEEYDDQKRTKRKIKFRYLCWKYIHNIRDKILPEVPINSKYEAVFIEFRIFPHVEFLLRNAIIKLGAEWSQTVVCGNGNYHYMKEMCEKISPNIRIIKQDCDNMTVQQYSNMLTSYQFWEELCGEKILIHQEDSCIFKTNINDFLKYDYIGAPWYHEEDWLKNYNMNNPVGNGGFSLRTKSVMLYMIYNAPVNNFPDGIFEDVYFSNLMQMYPNIGYLANAYTAYDFSSETIFNNDSFGGHCHFMHDYCSDDRFIRDCISTLYTPGENK